ncbi:MAG: hypothetical protein HY288_13745 [Planctomycetia bacterium]|nr:hypothetical protein [Planctomycetia bacterium]
MVLALTGGAAVLSIVLIGTSLFLFSRSSADQASVVSDGTTATSTKPRQDLARQLQDSRRRTDSDQAGRDKKLAAALDLFGDAASDASVEINAGRTVTTRSIAALRDAMEVTRAALKRRKLVEGWPLAAKNVAAKRKDAFIKLETTEKPTLEMVQSILGKEDSTEEDRKASVTWYKYGWCHFGVADKTVTFFRADGQYLNSGTWRVVTILRADCSAVKK